ncbi:phage holin family protein [Tenacibaculum halocynthiae]|uniref:phage holin family protein n=1 Tax=Tenacibaculum halocynthiae TaxID=1254437 RepID=UPI003D6481B1
MNLILKIKQHTMQLKFLLFLGVTGGVFSGLINMLLEDKNQFVAIFAVVVIDMIFGVLQALKSGTFQTKKSVKALYRIGAFWWLLATVLIIEDAFSFASFLSEAILLPILVFQLISVLKNMSLLGIISNALLLKILKNIDTHKHTETIEDLEELNPLPHE